MVQVIWKMLILYPKTSKEFYHRKKFQKSIMHWRWSVKKTVLKNFVKLTGKHLCWSIFFNKNTGLQACNFIQKRLKQGCFPDNIAKLLRITILKNVCERLLLRVFPFMLVLTFSYMKK